MGFMQIPIPGVPDTCKFNSFFENTYPWSPGHVWKSIEFMKIPIPVIPDTCKNQQILWKYLFLESWTFVKSIYFYENTYPWSPEPGLKIEISVFLGVPTLVRLHLALQPWSRVPIELGACDENLWKYLSPEARKRRHLKILFVFKRTVIKTHT